MGGKMSGYFYIKSDLNGLVLDVEHGNTSPGTRVLLWDRKHSDCDNQLFYDDHSTGTIRSKLNQFCLDIRGDTLVLNPFTPGNPNQQWMFVGQHIQNRLNHQQVLDVANADSSPGARVCAYTNNGQRNQRWSKEHASGHHHPGHHHPGHHHPGHHHPGHHHPGGFPPMQPGYPGTYPPMQPGYPGQPDYPTGQIPPSAPGYPGVGSQYFYVKSRLNGLVLDAEHGGRNPGTKLIMWNQKYGADADNQKFYQDGMTGTIQCMASGLCIEVQGSHVVLNNVMPGNMNQQWMLMGDQIALRSNPNTVLDIANQNSSPGAHLCAWANSGAPNQKWSIEYA